jgi:threonine synthase
VSAASTLVCDGCGTAPDVGAAYPFRCPNAGNGDIDHVLVRVLDPARVRFPTGPSGGMPFVRYRGLLHSYHRAIAGGLSDADFVGLVERLDRSVAGVDGQGFAATPFRRDESLSSRLGFSDTGGVWIKDETGNVAGSHKGRHLMGVLLHLEVAERLGQATAGDRPDLAIASCGNAALAAAVLARAGNRRLRVFVPADADPGVVGRLRDLSADVVVCSRRPGEAGDPCYMRLRRELATGALAFTCQGTENGLVIEGGETIGYEIASDVATTGGGRLEHLVVQVGGGALASACARAFREATELGVLPASPRIHTVQTVGAHPLERAYHRVAAQLDGGFGPADVARVAREAAAHRSAYMWPWEIEPRSVATGILDDVTYDWREVVTAMLLTGGQPRVVTEKRLVEAHELGTWAGFRVDPTGSAGLAGLVDLRAEGAIGPDERVAVLFTGAER